MSHETPVHEILAMAARQMLCGLHGSTKDLAAHIEMIRVGSFDVSLDETIDFCRQLESRLKDLQEYAVKTTGMWEQVKDAAESSNRLR